METVEVIFVLDGVLQAVGAEQPRLLALDLGPLAGEVLRLVEVRLGLGLGVRGPGAGAGRVGPQPVRSSIVCNGDSEWGGSGRGSGRICS